MLRTPPATLRVLALLVAATVCAAGCSVASADRPQRGELTTPTTGSPQTVVASGDTAGYSWDVLASESAGSRCLAMQGSDGGGSPSIGCDLGVPEREAVGSFPHQAGDLRFVVGPVAEDVSRVRVDIAFGDSVEVAPLPVTGLPVDVFVAPLPTGARAQAVIALGADGEEEDRVPV